MQISAVECAPLLHAPPQRPAPGDAAAPDSNFQQHLDAASADRPAVTSTPSRRDKRTSDAKPANRKDARDDKDDAQDPTRPVAVTTPATPLALLLPGFLQPAASSNTEDAAPEAMATEPLTLAAPVVVESDPQDAAPSAPEIAFAVRMLDTDAPSDTESAVAPPPAASAVKPAEAPSAPRTLDAASPRGHEPAPDRVEAQPGRPETSSSKEAPLKKETEPDVEPRSNRSDAHSLVSPFTTRAAASEPVAGAREIAAPEAAAAVAEPDAPAAARPAAARDIALHLTDANHQRVDVRLVETAGEIRVVARTPDLDLTRGLRNGLSELLNKLEHNGYQAEVWRPAEASFGETRQESRQNNPQQGFHGGQARPDDGRGNSRGGGQSRQPQWVEEMEELAGPTTNLEGGISHGYIR